MPVYWAGAEAMLMFGFLWSPPNNIFSSLFPRKMQEVGSKPLTPPHPLSFCLLCAGAEAMLMFDPEARAALLTADRAYSPGQEVFDSHGPGLSWADLVMDHGCVVEGQHDNPRWVSDVWL
jgi:hypothetical protein